MSFTKRDMEERERRWYAKADYKNWTCFLCGFVPPYDEREVFFDVGMCGHCAHLLEKEE